MVMNYYRVFGGLLASELEMPDLAAAERGRASWELSIAGGAPATPAGELLGTAPVEDTVAARLYRLSAGYRLVYDDTGSFDLLEGGTEIIWYPAPGASLESARVDSMGRVLALALHSGGAYSLHASAVAVGGGAVVFLAPKFHGKSTTAFALVRAGARLITDDTLAIFPGPVPLVRPGVQTVRLHDDSVAAINVATEHAVGESKGKYLVGNLREAQLQDESLPLAALYLLDPVASHEDGAAVRRLRLSPIHSAVALMGHTKLGPLLGGSESPQVLARAVAITARVPVHRLSVTRDFERLPEVVEQLLEWHGHPTTVRALEAVAS